MKYTPPQMFQYDDEFGDYKRSQRKKQKSLREAKKRTRSINVSRLSESDNRAWKGVFNG